MARDAVEAAELAAAQAQAAEAEAAAIAAEAQGLARRAPFMRPHTSSADVSCRRALASRLVVAGGAV